MTNRPPPGWNPDDSAKVASLEAKMGATDDNVKQLGVRLTGLESRFEEVASSLAQEFRRGLEGLSQNMSEKGSTKWGVIFSGLGVLLTFVIGLGTLAFIPINTGLNDIKAMIVPRTEFENTIKDIRERSEIAIKDVKERITTTDGWLRRIDSDRRAETRDALLQLQRENAALISDIRRNARQDPAPPPPAR